MTTKKTSKPKAVNASVSAFDVDKVLYADKITNIAIGPSVSRLTFGVEDDSNDCFPVAHLIIPTESLFESIDFISGNIIVNAEMKASLAKHLNEFQEEWLKTDGKSST